MMITTRSFTLATYQQGDRNAAKLALVLPGRLDTKDYVHMRSHVDFLASKGYFAMSFDPPGTWESPGDIALFTTTNYIKAVNELIEYFGNKPTILVGHSQGGSVAILVGVANPKVNAIVSVMSSFGEPSAPKPEAMKTGFQLSYRDLPPGDQQTQNKKEFALSIEYFTDGAKYKSKEVLKECLKPILLIYGTHDEFTEISEVKNVFNTIPGQKQIYELASYQYHDYRYSGAAIEEINKVTGEFLDVNNS